MHRIVPSLIVSLSLAIGLSALPAQALEGPLMTSARELDLAAQHLAAAAQRQTESGKVPTAVAERLLGFAAEVRHFRFALEAERHSSLGTEVAWARVARSFVATRDLFYDTDRYDDDTRDLRLELLRVHALMNRLDRGLGGTGFWSGPRGYPG